MLKIARLGTDPDLGETRLKRFDSHQLERNYVAWSSAPKMVPILVGFERVIPGLESYGRPATDHVVPASERIICHQVQGDLGTIPIVQGFLQELGPIDAAGHAAGNDKLGDLFPVLVRHQTEKQGEHVGVK